MPRYLLALAVISIGAYGMMLGESGDAPGLVLIGVVLVVAALAVVVFVQRDPFRIRRDLPWRSATDVTQACAYSSGFR